jgi:transcriptional regulator with XRE-family HTH domain
MTSPPDNSTGSPGPGRVLLALARDLTGRAQAARAAAEPVTGPELGAWLRAQREARTWTQDEMARRITAAARAAGDTSLPGTSSLAHNIYRWERGKHHLTDRYRLYYCRALGITPRDFGPARPPSLAALPGLLTAALTRWLDSPARPDPAALPSPPDQPAGHPLPELDALRLSWGDAYDITMSVGATIMKRLRGR